MSTVIKKRSLKQQGFAAEDAVCEHLRENGYTIVKRNFTVRGGEIDIIAAKDGVVAFVEVKRRGGFSAVFAPAYMVSAGQKRRIVAAADRFFETHAEFAEYAARFDVAVVCGDDCDSGVAGGGVADYAEDVFEKGLFL